MRYDLNLLKAFDALFRERNVSRAADRIGITQPAMSSLLSRLRDLFNDPLFIRDRYGVNPTLKAIEIHPRLEKALTELDALVQGEQKFDLATAERSFVIAANDYFECVILPELLKRIRKQAPFIKIETIVLTHNIVDSGIISGRTELVFGRITDPPDSLIVRRVLTEGFACLVSKKHPVIDKRISLAQFEQYRHVVVRPPGKLRTGIFQILKEKNIQRELACTVSHFQAVPALLLDSDHIATLPRRVCELFIQNKKLRMLDTPNDFGSFPFHLAWHQRYQKDPAHKWLRQQILDCCE